MTTPPPPSSSMSEEELAKRLLQEAHLFELHDPSHGVTVRARLDVDVLRQAAAALSRRPLTHEGMRGKALEEAAKRVIAEKFSTYKARNGRHVGVQDESGEMCWIIGHEAIFDLEEAIRALPLSHGGKE